MGSIAALKRTAIERLLAEEDFILIVINPRAPGVALPQQLIDARQPVPIHIGYRLALPIPDLVIDDAGIAGTLAFGERRFRCVFPWASLIQTSVRDEHLVWIVPAADAAPDDEGQARRRRLHLV